MKLNNLSRRWQFVLVGTTVSVGLLLAAVHQPAVFAVSGGSAITTSPVAVDLTGTPGSAVTTNLQVENNAPNPVAISVKLRLFKASGANGQAQILTPSPSDPSISWVHFSKTSFTAEPNVWNNVTMTVNLPKTAAFGYYYAVLFAPGIDVKTPAQDVNTVKSANAIFVLVDAHVPNEKTQLSVSGYQADRSSHQYLPVGFSVRVHNSGNVFTIPKGDIYISRSPGGKTIDTLDINPGQGNILPGSDRIFHVQWGNGFPVYQLKRINGQIVADKKGRPVQQLTWDLSQITKFRFGKYYARMVLVYNQAGRDIPVNGEVSFWVIPWGLILLAVAFPVVLILLWELSKKFIRVMKKKASRR